VLTRSTITVNTYVKPCELLRPCDQHGATSPRHGQDTATLEGRAAEARILKMTATQAGIPKRDILLLFHTIGKRLLASTSTQINWFHYTSTGQPTILITPETEQEGVRWLFQHTRQNSSNKSVQEPKGFFFTLCDKNQISCYEIHSLKIRKMRNKT
jgi:hypothetical protein